MKFPTPFRALALALSTGAASAASFDRLAKTGQSAGPFSAETFTETGELFIEHPVSGALSIVIEGADAASGDLLYLDPDLKTLSGVLRDARLIAGGAELLFTVDFDEAGKWGGAVLVAISLSGFDPAGATFLDLSGASVDVTLDAVQPVPAPAATWLLVSGVAALTGFGVRRRSPCGEADATTPAPPPGSMLQPTGYLAIRRSNLTSPAWTVDSHDAPEPTAAGALIRELAP